jgi:hypothetical protein
MLLTEYIELLQAFLEKHGNLPVADSLQTVP